MDQIIEMGGNATVIVKAICDFNGYKKDDILAILDDVSYSCDYSQNATEAEQGINRLLSFYEKTLAGVSLSNISMNKGLLDLFEAAGIQDKCVVTQIDNFNINEDNIYFLNAEPIDKDNIKLFPYTDYEYYPKNNSIKLLSNATIDDKFYVCYETQRDGINYDLNHPLDLPYVSVEIIGKGNNNKNNSVVNIKLPRVKIIDAPQFRGRNNGITYYNLNFRIINDKEDNYEVAIVNEK